MQENTYSKMIWFKDNYLCTEEQLRILDVGSLDKYGHYNYRDIFDCPNWNYDGLDLKKGNNVDIVVDDVYNWVEIPSKSYDVIISSFLWSGTATVVFKKLFSVCIFTIKDPIMLA